MFNNKKVKKIVLFFEDSELLLHNNKTTIWSFSSIFLASNYIHSITTSTANCQGFVALNHRELFKPTIRKSN